MKKIYFFGAIVLGFAACKPSVKVTPGATPGNADFTSYLAIGNSLTAGYADGSLYVTGQLNSYPERLFEQFSQVSPRGAQGPFVQPLLTTDQGYPGARMVLGETYLSCNPSDSSLGAISYPGWAYSAADAATYTSSAPQGQINNIGVPGIRVVDYPVAGYAYGNPYAARFYNNPAGSPEQELEYMVDNMHPTFFTMWLGANDVLGYALAGGQGNGTGYSSPGAGGVYNTSDISNFAAFESIYDTTIKIAISTGPSGGALINIPDITKLPYFNTIPANGLILRDQGAVDSMYALYPGSKYAFAVGANYFIIQDNAGKTRQAVPGELILITVSQDSIACAGWGTSVAIPKQYVITTDELQNIENAISIINAFIQKEALVYHLAYVDMNTFMNTVNTGYAYSGINYSTQYIAGGAFSLDGIHLTPRGYALVANQIIAAVNATYGSTVHPVDANQFNGILFP